MQQQQVAETAIVSDALRNIVLHIDGNSDARSADLSQLVVAHSGRYVQYPHWPEVTHLLANMLPAAKIKWFSGHMAECRRRGHPFFVVTEAWLVQSAAAKRRLPEADFALPTLLDPEQGSLRGFVKQAAAAAAQPPAAAAASSPPPPPAPEPPLPPPAPQSFDQSMMPPPPPKRPRHAKPPAPAASSSASSSAAASSTSSGWFVSVRVAAASGESPTQGSSAAACDAMQRRLLSAMRSQLGGGEAAEVNAYPLLPDQAFTLSPLQTIDETSLQALAKDLLKATDEDDAVALRAVGVGVARELGLAMTAALAAMRSSPTGGVRWLRSDGDASSLLGSRPISALMPLLHVSEYSTLSSEGVTTCSELVQFGEAALRMRFGPQRATWLLEAAQTALVPNNLLATIEQAGGLPPPPPPPPPPPTAAAPPPPPPPPAAFDDSDWEISCSQVDVSVISAIGGEEGERIRHQFETAQKQRAASSNGGGGSSSSTSAAPAAAVEEGPPAESGPHWDCSVCTYRHSGEEAEYLVCKQCFTQRPAGTIQPASGSQNRGGASSRPAPPPAQQQQQRSPTRRTGGGRSSAGKTSGRGGARGRGATPVFGRGSAGGSGTDIRTAWSPPSNGKSAGGRGGGGGGAAAASEANGGGDQPQSSAETRRRSLDFGARNDGAIEVVDVDADDDEMPPPPPPVRFGGSGTVLEPWETVRPHIEAWLEQEERPDPKLLLEYATRLHDRLRLDELGSLCELLETVCADRLEGCRPMLKAFADAVEGMVRERYAAFFAPLDGLRRLLGEK